MASSAPSTTTSKAASSRRLQRLMRHACGGSGTHSDGDSVKKTLHEQRAPVHWDGWGFDDTNFELNENGMVQLAGSRYSYAFKAARILPKLREYMSETVGLEFSEATKRPGRDSPPTPPAPLENVAFQAALQRELPHLKLATDGPTRVHHAHGHTCQEIMALRYGKFERVPDAVVFPTCHGDVEVIMMLAVTHDVCLIPFGGGTTVSNAVTCPSGEKRMIVTVSTAHMTAIKWVDRENMLACVEAGVRGTELEAKLKEHGVCMGHEPDSGEFSTMGGWVATRASGMKKNVYGNIEDILVNARVVTPLGTLSKGANVPRQSTGPDLLQMVLGSEGTLGIITEAIVRLRPLPDVQEFGSLVFPCFEMGVAAMREIAKQRVAPASIRLVDNTQFQFGRSLKPESDRPGFDATFDSIAKWYLTHVKGFVPEDMVAATLLFQGSKQEVALQKKAVFSIAKRFNGVSGGESNGKRGYFLTYMIAYLRDFAMNYQYMAESFETSVPWHKLCARVKARIQEEAEERGAEGIWVSCRVTQTYDTGAAVYFYFGLSMQGLKDPAATFSQVEHAARDEILKQGVGKHRKEWMPAAVGETGLKILRGLKKVVDPKNTLGVGNLM